MVIGSPRSFFWRKPIIVLLGEFDFPFEVWEMVDMTASSGYGLFHKIGIKAI
jgi:hypothetical protein